MSWDESADYSTDVVVPKWNFGKLIAVPGGSGPPGPKGDKGDTGEQGPVGPQGPAGSLDGASEIGQQLAVAEDEAAARDIIGAEYVGNKGQPGGYTPLNSGSTVDPVFVNARPVRVVRGAGIDLTGVADSTVAFQAILDAAAADFAAGSGIVEVYVPPGVLRLTNTINIGAGVTLRGAGLKATTLKSSVPNVAGTPLSALRFVGASDMTVTGLTIDGDRTTVIGIVAADVGLMRRVAITQCLIASTLNNPIRFPHPVQRVVVTGNSFENCGSGFSLYAPDQSTGLISSRIQVSRNRIRNCGSGIQLYGRGKDNTNPPSYSSIEGVEIHANDIADLTGEFAIPIEPTGVTNLAVTNNVIKGPGTRGVSLGSNVNAVITGNVITGQTFYAFELNGGTRMTITGNIAVDCKTFAIESADATSLQLSDVVIANNTYTGSGITAAENADVISLRFGRRVRISGNIFKDWQYLRSAIRVGNGSTEIPQDVVVEGNTFVVSDANTPLRTVHVRRAVRTSVVRNRIVVERALTATDNDIPAISVTMEPSSSDTLVEDNSILFLGSVTAATMASGVGNDNASAAACPRFTVRGNQITNGPRGLRLLTNSTDLIVYNNETSTCAGANVIPLTANFQPLTVTSLDVGAADTTLSRVSAGVLAVEGVQLSRAGHTHTASEVLGALSWAAVPASATSTGTAGQMAYANGFLYICVAANQWQRVALAAW